MKVYFLKCTLLIVLLITLLQGMASCSANEPGKESSGNNSKGITLYLYGRDRFIREIIDEYKINNLGIEVLENSFDNFEEYKKKLTSSIMAGKGPDVIYFNNYYIESINKVIKTGAFCDVQPFIDQDSQFNSDDYNQKVMDSGLLNNKRFFVPVNYSMPVLYTTQDVLNKNGINFNDGDLPMEAFFHQVEPFISSQNEGKDHYIFSDFFGFSEFILNSGLGFIDYDNKKVELNTPEFIELTDIYMKLRDYFCTEDIRRKYKNQEYEMFREGDILFFSGGKNLELEELRVIFSYIKNLTSQDIILYPFPSYNGNDGSIAIAEYCMAINENSKNKLQAYNFIKTALSEKVQSSNYKSNLPVNNKALIKVLDDATKKSPEDVIYNGTPIIVEPLPEEIRDKYISMTESIKKCVFIDTNANNLILNSLWRYFNGKTTLENAIKEAEKKIMLYLNE